MKRSFFILGLVALGLLVLPEVAAAQKIAYVDSEYILQRIPEFATVQQNIDRLAQDWESELEQKQQEIETLFREYQARELLFTQEERQRKRDEIVRAEENLERDRMKYFGPDGDLFTEQDKQLRPIQERVLTAVEEVATAEGYDYVFDKAGEFVFLYADEKFNLSDQVLEELGIEVDTIGRSGGQ